VHAIVYVKLPVEVAASVCEPDVASPPDQLAPSAPPPLAVHAVLLLEDHVSVTFCPSVTVVGLLERVTEGGGGGAARAVTVACAVAAGTPRAGLPQEMPKVYVPGAGALKGSVPLGARKNAQP
jgi:hypothetical protein